MKKDGIWIDEDGTGQLVDTFDLPCLPPTPKPWFRPGELAVRVGTVDVYQVIYHEADLPERKTRQAIGGYERDEGFYLAQKVRILEPRSLGLVPCEVGAIVRLRDRELQPRPPGSRLLEPARAIASRPRVDLVGRASPVPAVSSQRPALTRHTTEAPRRLIAGKALP